ncbi:hypothetical protein M409DRAFT_66509 [Zasmidium cellare ATCC 36951]|uniref:Eisosome protein 1 n=1 Tax=Zasmidium cellare ATCC 36951 TaxID=1080233 RepID=A0A6A6CGW4_ZASCE|nr:uncharacterized protein M409DRAFT_66509 [Zasmidium cellare ATCC 36951]KAF2166434.1 hypothetical protein M409DRAFT_66509 [Zasmidium cellare ATCC 36951]
MAAATASEKPCPDPSVHEKHTKLSEQASSAALYVTHPERNTEPRESRESPLGPDGNAETKSTGAATSLKYAKATDLPSFPSHGHTADSAGKAAMLAKDYKMKELWQPELSQAGSRAALVAHGKGGNVELWQASATSDGHSAATLAMRNKTLSPNVDYSVTPENRSKALRAATMSHHTGRQRAESTPQPPPPAYPDSHRSGANALNAATASHRASTLKSAPDGWDSEANQAARIKNLGGVMDRSMFTDHPDIDVGNEEAKRQQALRASAVSMAKRLYESQNRTALTSDPDEIAGAQAAANRSSTSTQPDLKTEAMRYINLQEAAHKLATERLAKVDKNFENARYREYYGYEDKPKRLSSNMSLRSKNRGRQRNRASSDTATADFSDSDDEEQARRIRTQMSALQGGLSQVDQKKQQDDRAKLLAAAEKRVSARMHNMDEKVYNETGKIPPALQEQWEAQARERAQKERELAAENPGKTHIGGGKFMDQSEIEAIAAARLKPTLDEINDTAEKKRARDEEIRTEKEEQERVKREDKAQKKEEKEEQKRVKDEQRAAAKQEKAEEKARKEGDKRLSKDDKRKSREHKRDDAGIVAAGGIGAGAGAAALAEGEAGDEATDGVQKHRSALSRLKERFRRSQPPGDEKVEDEEEKPATGATVATGAAGGAITGATLEEAADKPTPERPEELDHQQAEHAVAVDEASPVSPVTATENDAAPSGVAAGDEETSKWNPVVTPAIVATGAGATAAAVAVNVEDTDAPVAKNEAAKPQRPGFEQKPSLAGYNYDEDSLLAAKPDLEQHISHIPESDDDSDDDDWNDERVEKPVPTLGADKAQVVADRVGTAPVTDKPIDDPIPTNDRTDETLAQLNDQRAEPPKDLPSTLETPGVPKPEPAVEPTATSAAPAETETKESTELEQKPTKTQEAAAFAIGVATAGTADVDPTKIAAKSSKTEPEKKTAAERTEKPDRESKGFRGFFKKLRNRDSRSENKVPDALSPTESNKSVPYESTKPGDAPTTDTTTNGAKPTLPPVETGPKLDEEHVGTDGIIGSKDQVSGIAGNPAPESPSSFRRGETALNDPDDLSSSGADEDDVARGRGTGRISRKLGFGRDKGKGKATNGGLDAAAAGDSDRQNSNTEDEQFEEARDHFDETLAPPPAFAGQAKSESPVRGTKFQEEL